MAIRTLAALDISDPSAVSEARRMVGGLAGRFGFSDAEAGKVSIVVTELATNLYKHAGHGELVINAVDYGERGYALQVMALDQGRGIADVAGSLRDGYSTAGSPGTGLGAIQRLARDFEIYTLAGRGSAMLARLWAVGEGPRVPGPISEGGLSVSRPGESVCGDSWALMRYPSGTRVLVVDGLGHGIEAADASQLAVAVFRRQPMAAEPPAILAAIHEALRATRGAVAAVAEIDREARLVRYAGVGNISGVVLSDSREQHLVSHNGTLGADVRKIQQFTYPWPERGLMILHSDGLSQRWNLRDYPGLVSRHPTLIAGVLYRDFRRAQDDTTVVALKDVEMDNAR
jgi:anti-sigma regulatory factor (Ser/Thr protein kinase)